MLLSTHMCRKALTCTHYKTKKIEEELVGLTVASMVETPPEAGNEDLSGVRVEGFGASRELPWLRACKGASRESARSMMVEVEMAAWRCPPD